ncbi:glycosyltransferase family 4 protein [Glutamicibacter endophyticus]|uniref:glycosyltransferase family 4 protein n=1 Tax=Glutamicibacter endophyticus TaxID=1522174 RepID=UPI003AF1007B
MKIRAKVTACNVVNVVRLVVANLRDEPSYFFLQVIRKFKGSASGHLSDCLKLMPVSRVKSMSIRCILSDRSSDLDAVVKEWLASNAVTTDGFLLADVCIAMYRWDLAEEVLSCLPNGQRATRRKARLQWHFGDLRGALELLETIPASRQQKHYLSEYRTLSGTSPSLRSRLPSNLRVQVTPKSVLYFATNSLPNTGSGYAQRTHSILRSLIPFGWSPLAVTRALYPVSVGHVLAPEVETVDAIAYRRIFPFPARHDLSGRLQQQTDELFKITSDLQPQILHTTTDYTNALSVSVVARELRIPWVYEVRGQLADTWASTRGPEAKNSERYSLFVQREAEMARGADFVITLGEEMRSNLIAAGVSEDRIAILPNAVGERFLSDPVPRHEARRILGLEQEAFFIGTISSIVPYEGLDTVLKAISLVRDQISQLRLLIVGDGTDLENLKKLASDLEIENICVFTGRVPREKAHLYHAALNAFVVPRKDLDVTRSVTPLKPVEALASRVPVLASDLPALRELITNGENGHLIPPEDPIAWSEAIVDAANQPELLESMGQRGREMVLNTRTWDANARRLVEIYEQVTKESR